MKTQIIKQENLLLKTVKRIEEREENLYLFFDDDTYCRYSSSVIGQGESEIELNQEKIQMSKWNIDELLHLDIISPIEAERFLYELSLKEKEETENREKRVYEELKSKYESDV